MKKTFLSVSLAAVLVTRLAVSGAQTVASAPLPAECSDYLKKLEVCIGRANGTSPDAARSARQLLESVRQQWSEVTDKAALAQACKQASENALPQITAKMGCN